MSAPQIDVLCNCFLHRCTTKIPAMMDSENLYVKYSNVTAGILAGVIDWVYILLRSSATAEAKGNITLNRIKVDEVDGEAHFVQWLQAVVCLSH